MNYLPLSEADLDAVASAEARIYPFPWTRGNFADSLANGHAAWQAREDAQLVGYAVTMQVLDEVHLLNISVMPERQSQGCGSALLRHLFAAAKAQGAVRMLLEVRTSNGAAQRLYLRHGFRDLITQQAVDIIMPDIPKCGGLSECRKIANLAEIYYIPFAPHNVASPIGTMASCHVCATIPNFLVIEFHWLHRDYWSTITTDKEDIIKNGYITPTDRPGIGLELDETVARAHQYPGTTWFE